MESPSNISGATRVAPHPLGQAALSTKATGTPRAYTRSNVTRLLSAGAYLERPFRQHVISELVKHWYRVVAPSYGYDAVTVLAHALAARSLWRKQIAGVALGAPAVFVLYAQGVIGAVGALLLTIWLLWASDFLRRAAALQALITLRAPDRNPAGSGAMAGVTAVEDSGHDYPANRTLTPELVEKIAREQAGMQDKIPGKQDMILYGGYYPFVGAGERLLDWSMAELLLEQQPHPLTAYLDRGARDGDDPVAPKPVIPFTVIEITDYVAKHLLAYLSDDTPHGEQIAHLKIERRKYCRVDMVPLKRRWWRRFLRRPPAPAEIKAFRPVKDRERYDAAREYLCIRIGSWDQELVTSIFVGFDLRGNTLYSEFHPYVLAPVIESFHLVERLPETLTVKLLLRVAWHVPARLPRLMVRVVLGVLLLVTLRWLWQLAQIAVLVIRAALLSQAEVLPDRVDDTSRSRLGRYTVNLVDTGAVRSVRELASADDFRHFFQEADAVKYIKVVERRLLQVIRNFLAEHNVDLRDHDAQQNVILDNSTRYYRNNATVHGDGNISQGGRGNSQSLGRRNSRSSGRHDSSGGK